MSQLSYSDLIVSFLPAQKLTKLPEKWEDDTVFCPSMLRVEWTAASGWGIPYIEPLHSLQLHPAALVLHFAIQAMESLKVYRGVDDRIRLFRPQYKLHRLLLGAEKAALPPFDEDQLLQCISELVRVNEGWVPPCGSGTLYLRPVFIATEQSYSMLAPRSALLYCVCTPSPSVKKLYASSGGIKLYVDVDFNRTWPGWVGDQKMACVFAPTTIINEAADKSGCHMPLWVFGEECELTEAGGMNIFIVWTTQKGLKELVTPPLTGGLILPGVTRDSLLTLAKESGTVDSVREQKVRLRDLEKAVMEGRLLEMFGSGTGALINPIVSIHFKNSKKIWYLPSKRRPVMTHLGSLLKNIQEARSSTHSDWMHLV